MKLPLQNVLRQSARYLTGMAIMTSLTTMAVAFDPVTTRNCSWVAFDSVGDEDDQGKAVAVYLDNQGVENVFVGGNTSDGKIYISGYKSVEVPGDDTQEKGSQLWEYSGFDTFSGSITDYVVDSTSLYAVGYIVGSSGAIGTANPTAQMHPGTFTGGQQDIIVIEFDLTVPQPDILNIWLLGGSGDDQVSSVDYFDEKLYIVGKTTSSNFIPSPNGSYASGVDNGVIASISVTDHTMTAFVDGVGTENRKYVGVDVHGGYAFVAKNATLISSGEIGSEIIQYNLSLTSGGLFGNKSGVELTGIGCHSNGSIIVSGTDSAQTSSNIYIASYSPSLTSPEKKWEAKYSHDSATSENYCYGMSLDPDGYIYMIGETGDPQGESCILQVTYAPEGHLVSVTTYGNRGEPQTAGHNGAGYDIAVNQYGDAFIVGNASIVFDRLYMTPGEHSNTDRDLFLIQSKASIFQQDGEPFYPIGFNFTRVSSCGVKDQPGTCLDATQFIGLLDGVYNGDSGKYWDFPILPSVDTDLTTMANEGFNVVRTFLNTDEVFELDVDNNNQYIFNLVHFLYTAQAKGILVHLTTFQIPTIPEFESKFVNPYYSDLGNSCNFLYLSTSDTVAGEVDGVDIASLDPSLAAPGLELSVSFWVNVLSGINDATTDPDLGISISPGTIFDNLIIEPYNEPFLDISKVPFNLSKSDMVIDGEPYSWEVGSTSDEEIRRIKSNLAYALAKRWANAHKSIIERADVDILVGASPYTNHDRGVSPSHLDEYGQRELVDVWKNTDPSQMDIVETYPYCGSTEPYGRSAKRPLSYAALLDSDFDWVGGNIYLDRGPYVERDNFHGYEKFDNRRSPLLAKGMLSTSLDGYGLKQPIMSAEFGYMVFLFDPLEFFDTTSIPYKSFYFDDDDMYNNAIDVNWLQTELLRRYRFRGFNYWGWDTWTRYYDPNEPVYDDPEKIYNPIGDNQYNLDHDGFCLCDLNSSGTGDNYDYTRASPFLSFDAIYGATDAFLKTLSPLQLSGIPESSLDALNTSVEDIGLIKSVYYFDPPSELEFHKSSSEDIPVEIFFYQTGAHADVSYPVCTETIRSRLGKPVYRIQVNVDTAVKIVDLYNELESELNILGITLSSFQGLAIGIHYIYPEDGSGGLDVVGDSLPYTYSTDRKLRFDFNLTGHSSLHILHPGSRGEDVAKVRITIENQSGEASLTEYIAAKEHYRISASKLIEESGAVGLNISSEPYCITVESFEKDSGHLDDHAVKIVAGCIEQGGSRNYPTEATVNSVLDYDLTTSSDLIGYTPEIADCYTTPSVSLMGHWIEVDVPAGRKISVTSREIDLYGVAVGIYSETGDTLLACDYSDSSTVTEATATWSNSGTATATVLILANHHADSNLAEVEIECFPINDDCADATEVFCGTSLDGWFLEGATRDGSCTCAGTLVDVWYKIEIPFSGTKVQADYTRNASFGYVALFTGTCGSLTEQSCGPLSTSFTTSADAQTVYIRLSAFGVTAEQGLDIICTSPTTPSNDERTGSASISCGYSMSGVITNGASVSTSPVANPCAIATAKDVWFRYDTPAGYPSATLNQGYGPEVTIEFEDDHLYGNPSSSYSGFIAIYEGTRLVDYRCNRTAADATGKFTLTVKLGPSLPYYIRIGSDSPSPDKYFSFSCNSKLP